MHPVNPVHTKTRTLQNSANPAPAAPIVTSLAVSNAKAVAWWDMFLLTIVVCVMFYLFKISIFYFLFHSWLLGLSSFRGSQVSHFASGDEGSYQSLEAQRSCVACPSGRTTRLLAATKASDAWRQAKSQKCPASYWGNINHVDVVFVKCVSGFKMAPSSLFGTFGSHKTFLHGVSAVLEASLVEECVCPAKFIESNLLIG